MVQVSKINYQRCEFLAKSAVGKLIVWAHVVSYLDILLSFKCIHYDVVFLLRMLPNHNCYLTASPVIDVFSCKMDANKNMQTSKRIIFKTEQSVTEFNEILCTIVLDWG